MTIRLPTLTWELDCEPIGYPSLVFEFWLNPPPLSDEEVSRLERGSLFDSLARIVERVRVPAAFTGDGVEQVIEIAGDGARLRAFDRECRDPQLLVWAANQYRVQRGRRLEAGLKN